jgi:hypothetical protein
MNVIKILQNTDLQIQTNIAVTTNAKKNMVG